jgi:hypothetical protein
MIFAPFSLVSLKPGPVTLKNSPFRSKPFPIRSPILLSYKKHEQNLKKLPLKSTISVYSLGSASLFFIFLLINT